MENFMGCSFVLNLIFLSLFVFILILYLRKKRKLRKIEIKYHECIKTQRIELKKEQLGDLLDLFYNNRIYLNRLRTSLEKMRNKEAQLWVNKLNKDVISKDFYLLCGRIFTFLYPGFLARLKTKYPSFIVSELRILVLLRLDCELHKIPIILNIAEPSVNATIYKIKNKMGLSNNDSLREFIKSF